MKSCAVLCLSMAFTSCLNAITLNVGVAKNNASLQHNTGSATAVNSTSSDMREYEISIYRSKTDKGQYRLFAMTSVFMSEANGGMKAKKGTLWIPQSLKMLDLRTNDIGKTTYIYSTPVAKFEKEKWRYIGNFSRGCKINGALIGLISIDNDKIVKIINKSTGTKVPETISELKTISENKNTADILERSGYFASLDAKLESTDTCYGKVLNDTSDGVKEDSKPSEAK